MTTVASLAEQVAILTGPRRPVLLGEQYAGGACPGGVAILTGQVDRCYF
ncbi:hypothetical protein NLX83_04160 [Allokutzneria sp. A3M-2-11 16]|nr:hypothetical protein [Allokutzneria sp. A3M-2-11 16]MCP3798448.1 hypothetical protein [Allokutzneria sp. A3M-2-11 16]